MASYFTPNLDLDLELYHKPFCGTIFFPQLDLRIKNSQNFHSNAPFCLFTNNGPVDQVKSPPKSLHLRENSFEFAQILI